MESIIFMLTLNQRNIQDAITHMIKFWKKILQKTQN